MLQRTAVTLKQVIDALKELRRKRREIKKIEARRDEKIAELVSQAAIEIAPHMEEVERHMEVVERYAEANRFALTNGNRRKYGRIQGWVVKWRLTKKVVFRGKKSPVKKLIAYILKHEKFKEFVVYKPQLDRTAMHKNPQLAQKLPWVKGVLQEEGFSLELDGKDALRRDPFTKKLAFVSPRESEE